MSAKSFPLLVFLLLVGCKAGLFAQSGTFPANVKINQTWVDSVFATLTPDEKIAQLIMVAAVSDPERAVIDASKSNPEAVSKLIRENKIGGIVFFQGGPVPQAQLTNYYQRISKVPLLVAMDAEWGLAMRLDSTVRYPYQMTLGAIQGNNDLIYRMGAELATQARRLGVHVNFAPVADVNNNPNNPVISFRSFGENQFKVAEKAIAYMRGMQDHGLLTSAKHFPGHGDTGVDSHYNLPVIQHDLERLEDIELYPFKEMIRNGLTGVMMAHLSIPALDSTPNLPSTLSKPIVTGLLKDKLGFRGLVFSDAMNMKGVTNFYTDGKADAMGLAAGMDILEFTEDVPKAIAEIKKMIEAGELSWSDIDTKCRKVLEAKSWVGLDQLQEIKTENLYEDLNPKSAELTNRLLTEHALTILKNDQSLLPLQSLDTLKIASVSIGSDSLTAFQNILGLYTEVAHFTLSAKSTENDVNALFDKLKEYNMIIAGVHLNSISPRLNFGLTPVMQSLLNRINQSGKGIVTYFGNPYVLNKIDKPENARSIIMAYQLTRYTEELSAQLIFGAIPAKGKLPVTINERFPFNTGFDTHTIGRLKYTIPEELGLNSDIITFKIDSIVNNAISVKATPGCVVELAKDGKVFFMKAYGNAVYGGAPVKVTDLYDLASVTKVTAATLGLLSVYDQGKFDLDAPVSAYLPKFKKSNKADLKWRDILTHKSRLKAFIVFWKEAQNPDGTWKNRTFSTENSRRYPVSIVRDSLFMHRNYAKKMFKGISDSDLNKDDAYVYSDLSFMLYPQIIRSLTGEEFESYLKRNFYQPIGATSLTFNPLRFYKTEDIIPTEIDTFFRKTLIHGQVHDEAAAMLGGVSGHAGLFGNANDVMKVWQMYLQNGYYGGRQYISEPTMKEFTRYQFPEIKNRRGIGFDKPTFDYSGNAPRFAGPESFGHTGFTGIMTWADPVAKLTYVFLSNRVYPTRDNPKLFRLNVRTEIMDVIYKELQKNKLQ